MERTEKMTCIIVDKDLPSRIQLEKLVRATGFLTLSAATDSTEEAFNRMNKEQIDLALVDTGTGEGCRLANMFPAPAVILITPDEQREKEICGPALPELISKPIAPEVFLRKLNGIHALYRKSWAVSNAAYKNQLFIRRGDTFRRIFFQDIKRVSAVGNYTELQMQDDRFIIRMSFQSVKAKLPPEKFAWVNHGCIAAKDYINHLNA